MRPLEARRIGAILVYARQNQRPDALRRSFRHGEADAPAHRVAPQVGVGDAQIVHHS